MEEFELKDYLASNILFLRMVGLWPKKDYASEKLYLLYAVILNVFFIQSVNIEITLYALLSTNLEEFINRGYFVYCIMGCVKVSFLVKYQKTFKELRKSEVFKVTNVALNSRQRNILSKAMGVWTKIQRTYIIFGVVHFAAYVAGPILEKEAYSLPLVVWYPFDYEKPIVYQMVYFHQTVGGWGNVTLFCGGDKLLCAYLAYIAAECEVLADMLRNLDENLTENEHSLVQCIKYHKEIIRYTKSVGSYFSKYLLIQFGSACLSTALLMTKLSMSTVDGDFMFMITLQCAAWVDLFIYCWFGTKLTTKSEDLPYAAFESNWVDASTKFKQDLVFFIHRIQTPIKLYAVNFFELSIDTFTNILRTAWSYYTLLIQLSDEE